MSEFLVGLCSYIAFQSSGQTACQTTTKQVYSQSTIKTYFDQEQRELERYGLGIYDNIPLNKTLGTAAIFGYEMYKKDFKLSLTKSINLEYNNFNAYTCNLKWEF